jgi:hypothetical protein
MPVKATDERKLFNETEELANVNGKLLDNFLEGLWKAGLRPKRVLLQTGAKVKLAEFFLSHSAT